MDNTFGFLSETLGNDGAVAVRRAVKKSPTLQGFLLPRTVLGWTIAKSEWRGTLPGFDQLYLEFVKSTGGITGKISMGSEPLRPLSVRDDIELAAEILSHFNVEVKKFEGGAAALARLGKSIDVLLKSREAIRALRKGAQELPGQTAQPREPEGPAEPQKPVSVQPKMARTKPKLPKLPVLKVELDKMAKTCSTCGSHLFKAQRFSGCLCWRDLAKHASTTVYSDGAVVSFDSKADRASVQTLWREFHE